MNFDLPSIKIKTLEFNEYLERVKERIGFMNWKESFNDAVEQFYTFAKEEYEKVQENSSQRSFD